MKVLVVLGFCFAVASATPLNHLSQNHLNLGREPVSAERTPDQPDDQELEQQVRRKLNSVRLQLVDNDKKHATQLGHSNLPAAQRTYYGQSYDLGSLSFRYYSPYYYGAYRPPYYDTGDYYNKNNYNNRYYKGYGTYGGDKGTYRLPTGTGYGYDGQGYTNTYYNAHQPYLRGDVVIQHVDEHDE